MSLEVLRLGSIKLEDTSEKLILVANATVELRVKNPDGQLTDWNKDLLETGNIWVTRGAGLSLDVEIYFNGNPLDENCCLDILQTVGHRVVDAKVGSLSFLHFICLSASSGHLCVFRRSSSFFPSQNCRESPSRSTRVRHIPGQVPTRALFLSDCSNRDFHSHPAYLL